jgi:hypothetical protein
MTTTRDAVISSWNGFHDDAVNSVAAITADLDTLVTQYTEDDAATLAGIANSLIDNGLPAWANLGGSQNNVVAVYGGPISPLPLTLEYQAVSVSLCLALLPVFEALGADGALIAALTVAANAGPPLGGSLPNPFSG